LSTGFPRTHVRCPAPCVPACLVTADACCCAPFADLCGVAIHPLRPALAAWTSSPGDGREQVFAYLSGTFIQINTITSLLTSSHSPHLTRVQGAIMDVGSSALAISDTVFDNNLGAGSALHLVQPCAFETTRSKSAAHRTALLPSLALLTHLSSRNRASAGSDAMHTTTTRYEDTQSAPRWDAKHP